LHEHSIVENNVNLAIEAATARQDELIGQGISDFLDCCLIAHFHEVLHNSATQSMEDIKEQSALLHERIEISRENTLGREQVPDRLYEKVTQFIIDYELRNELMNRQQAAGKENVTLEMLRKEPWYRDWRKARWGNVNTLLRHPRFTGLHTDNLDALHDKVNTLIKGDRMPKENSLEALLLLRAAWDLHDECSHIASLYKRFAKFTFVVFLVISVVTTAATVGRPEDIGVAWGSFKSRRSEIIFLISMLGSLISATVSFYNPLARWRICRGIAQHMHSQIWKFRLRIPPFNISSERGAGGPEAALAEAIVVAREQLLNGGDVRETAVTRRYGKGVYTHGQRSADRRVRLNKVAPRGVSCFDDHCTPLEPAKYIELRLEKMLHFYQSRIPRAACLKTYLEIIIMLGASTSSVAAYYGHHRIVAVITSFTTALAAYKAFHGTEEKIARYNNCATQLRNLLTWWCVRVRAHHVSAHYCLLLFIRAAHKRACSCLF